MKATILTIVVLFSSLMVNAQLEVIEDKSQSIYSNIKGQTLVMFPGDTDTTYAFYFKDMQYQYIVKIEYLSLSKEELVQFLELCLDVIDKKRQSVMTEKYAITKFMNNATLRMDSSFTNITRGDIIKMQSSIQ
jgi:hypothetical protein